MSGSDKKNAVSAFDFDIMRGAIIKIAASEGCPLDLRAAAREIAEDFCPDKKYPDEIIDALVKAAQKSKVGPDAVRRSAGPPRPRRQREACPPR